MPQLVSELMVIIRQLHTRSDLKVNGIEKFFPVHRFNANILSF
jgi:hypothetical protein